MATTLRVALAVPDAVNLIHHTITTGGVTAEMTDWYERISPEGRRTLLMVFEKHFWRANNRLTLTVTVDDLDGTTCVHWVGGGGGALINFDWGAADSFERELTRVLNPYRIM